MPQIDKNIPIPAKVIRSGGRPSVYDFHLLTEEGDSLFISEEIAPARKVQSAAASFSRRHGVPLVTRQVYESKYGVRVWRQ